jgi:ribosomal-protein-alanine N-acetyltransferase
MLPSALPLPVLRLTLPTKRLLLRPLTRSDAATVQQLAGDREVAGPTLGIPHPYPDGFAEQWIEQHEALYLRQESLTLAITLKHNAELVGAISLLQLSPLHQRAELGYWVGKHHWSTGYCTEAAAALLRFGFDTLGLHRVESHCLRSNVRSTRVLLKLGFAVEGCQRQHLLRGERFEDLVMFGLLRHEWAAA